MHIVLWLGLLRLLCRSLLPISLINFETRLTQDSRAMEDTAACSATEPPYSEERGVVESRVGRWILANLEDGPRHAQRIFQSNIAREDNLVISLLSERLHVAKVLMLLIRSEGILLRIPTLT